jgi:exosome complex RNA-binding protein Rrp42 (RNase PH superfamily)
LSSPFADYLASVDKTLRDSPFVNDFQTQHEDRGEVWFLRVNVYFIDNSLLHFRELFVGQKNPLKKTYTYHYQWEDGTIVFRYDNAPHFPHLPTAPHHKHIGENEVVAANAPNLESVLKEIEGMIKT